MKRVGRLLQCAGVICVLASFIALAGIVLGGCNESLEIEERRFACADDSDCDPAFECATCSGRSVCVRRLAGGEEIEAGQTHPSCVGACLDFDLGSAVGSVLSAEPTAGSDIGAVYGCSDGGLGEDTVFSWTAPADGCFELSTDSEGTSFDTVLAVFPDCERTSEVACNDDAGGSPRSTLTFEATRLTTYVVVVDGFSNQDEGAFDLRINRCGSP